MKIDIRYKLIESAEWIHYPISPNQYFESVDEPRSWEWDDVPRYLHAVDFLPVSKAEVSETELRIWDPDERLRLTICEVLWNSGLNRVIQRTEDNFTLLIVQFRVTGPPETYHTIRLNREADGRLLLEQMQLAVTEQGDVPGPSHIVQLPALTVNEQQRGPISLRYRLVGSTDWQTHAITPMEYYKPNEDGAPFNWDDAPKYEHASEYLPLSPDEIVETEVRLADDTGKWRREISEVLWNYGQNRIVNSVDEQNTSLKIQARIQEKSLALHTIHLVRNVNENDVLEHEVGIDEVGGKRSLLIARRRL
jgi:hypothetical protein